MTIISWIIFVLIWTIFFPHNIQKENGWLLDRSDNHHQNNVWMMLVLVVKVFRHFSNFLLSFFLFWHFLSSSSFHHHYYHHPIWLLTKELFLFRDLFQFRNKHLIHYWLSTVFTVVIIIIINSFVFLFFGPKTKTKKKKIMYLGNKIYYIIWWSKMIKMLSFAFLFFCWQLLIFCFFPFAFLFSRLLTSYIR